MSDDESLPLHELNPTGRFSDRAADYVKHRPGYPAAAIAAVLSGLGEPAALLAADIGAGTGIWARQIATRGVRVLAVEPNVAMRAAAAPHPLVEWREGTAEATGLADASVDLVTCAQAFHWFRPPEALAEFARILRPGGRLALVWNNRDHSDPLTRGYIGAIRAVSGEHPVEMRDFDPAVIAFDGAFTEPRLETFPHAQRLDLEGLIGRATSASYVPREGPANAALVARFGKLFARHRDSADRVLLRYVTSVHLAERL